MGESAIDSPNGARAVLIGYTLRANVGGGAGQADDQVLIGNTIQVPSASRNSQGLVAIGASTVFTAFLGTADSFGGSVVIGNTAGLVCLNVAGGDASNAVSIGAGTRAHGGSVIIGPNALSSNLTATAIGQGALAGLQAVGIGLNADATAVGSVSIGDRARAGTAYTIAIGWFADTANSDSSIAIGRQANTNGKFANIMLGRNASVAADNYMQIGGVYTYFIGESRFGAGYTPAVGGVSYIFGTTTASGSNNLNGNTLVVRAGSGTGNSAGNVGIDFQCGLVQASGGTSQPFTSVLALRHSDLNVALWGGLAAPFSGGAGVMFVKNAATNPTVAAVAGGGILSVQGGELHWLSSAGVDTALTGGAESAAVVAATVTLTDAQIKTLPTTPFTLVAAPGANKVIVPVMVAIDFDGSHGAYTNIAAAANMQASWNGSGQATARLLETGLGQVSALIATGAKQRAFLPPIQVLFSSTLYAGNPQAVGGVDNVPLQLVVGNPALGNFTGGNVGNSARVTVLYYVLTVV